MRTSLAVLVLSFAPGACDRDESAAPGTRGPSDESAISAASTNSAGALGFTGVFHAATDGGHRSVLNLTERDGKLTGMLDANNISGTVSGVGAAGDVRDPRTAARIGTIELSLGDGGASVLLRLTAIDGDGAGTLALPAVSYRRGAPPPIDVQLDAHLAGRWRPGWSSGEDRPDATGEKWLILNADGTLEYGVRRASAPAPAAADADAIDTSGDDALTGKWRTSERTLHVMPDGHTQWIAFARYQREADRLLLTFNDGSQQTYYRP